MEVSHFLFVLSSKQQTKITKPIQVVSPKASPPAPPLGIAGSTELQPRLTHEQQEKVTLDKLRQLEYAAEPLAMVLADVTYEGSTFTTRSAHLELLKGT